MKRTYTLFLLPALLTLGCSPSSDEGEATSSPAASTATPDAAAPAALPAAAEAVEEAPAEPCPPAEEDAAATQPEGAIEASEVELTEVPAPAAEEPSAAPAEEAAEAPTDAPAEQTAEESPEAAPEESPEDSSEEEAEEFEEEEEEEDTSSLLAPEDTSIQLPYFSPRPLPSIFAHWQEVLLAQSEPDMLLGCKKGEPLNEEDQYQFDETREHVHEALEAARELFLAQMALVRGPLNHPSYCSMEPEEIEECLEVCEAYLADSFHRDLEHLSYCFSFLDKGCVKPTLRPGQQAVLHRSELDSLLWARTDGGTPVIAFGYDSLNSEWQRRQLLFMAEYLASYEEDGSFNGHADRDPFTGMCGLSDSVLPTSDPEGDATPGTVDYLTAMRELVRREQRAWQRYFTAMGELVCPCSGYRGSGAGIFTLEYESYLLDSRERFLYMLAVGADGVHYLSHRSSEREAELRELHATYSFGEIFTESAQLFRHPGLAGRPWCIRFPNAGAGFIFLKENEVLQQYAAACPEGGEIEVRGYQMIESIGEPYETVREKYRSYKRIPAEKPYGALELRQVFHLLEYGDSLEDEQEDDSAY